MNTQAHSVGRPWQAEGRSQGHSRAEIKYITLLHRQGRREISAIISMISLHDAGNVFTANLEQESPAIADKPVRRESLPKIAPIRRAYNVVADYTGLSSFV